jgi:hypothetical protein
LQEDNITLYLIERRCEDMDWIHLARDRISGNALYVSKEGEAFFARMRDYQLLKKTPVPWTQTDAFFNELPNVFISVSNTALCVSVCHSVSLIHDHLSSDL